MTLSRHRPSSTRNRPCCGERNTYLVWPRDDLLPVRWGFFESPPSLASLESFYSVRLSLLQINYMSSYNNGLLCGVGIRAWRAGPDRNRDVSLTHGSRSMSHVVTSPPTPAADPRSSTLGSRRVVSGERRLPMVPKDRTAGLPNTGTLGPRRACAGRTVDARARRRVSRRTSSDITAPPALLVAPPARLYQSRHRRRRASAEPRASRRADRAPPTSSCVRRSYRRRTCAPPCAPPCVE